MSYEFRVVGLITKKALPCTNALQIIVSQLVVHREREVTSYKF